MADRKLKQREESGAEKVEVAYCQPVIDKETSFIIVRRVVLSTFEH